jgi:tetratricopeptide (TPR) repeat protein
MAQSSIRISRAKLREKLNANFSVDELQLLADDLGVEFAGLPGDGKEAKVLHFIRRVEAKGEAPALLAKCSELRPDVTWGEDLKRWDKVKPFVLAAVAAIGVIFAAIVLYVSVVPAQMPAGSFNIAIAEFGALGEGGADKPASGGMQLSASVYQRLSGALNALPDAVKVDRRPQVWFDGISPFEKRVTIGVVVGNDDEARREHASNLTKDLNANLLIYGNYTATQEGGTTRAELTPEFYIRADSRDADEFTGRQQLGRPITIRLDASGVIESGASSALRTRQDALSRIAIALLYDANGSNDRALEFLKQADVELPKSEWPDQDGRELLYYLIGREALLLSSAQTDEQSALRLLDEAADYFERALKINPAYPAAKLAQASTRVQQANWLAKRSFATVEWNRIALSATQSISDTLIAQTLKRAEDQSPFNQKAQAILGDAYRLLGVAQMRMGQFEASKSNLDRAVQLIDAQLKQADALQTRFRAQLQLLLGVVYHERARLHKFGLRDADAGEADYASAENGYKACANDPKAYDDAYIGRLRDLQCGPYLALLESER